MRHLDAAEVREALGISQATYYRWLREGRLKGVRAGRRWRFEQRVVDELLRGDDPAPAEARRICKQRLEAIREEAVDDMAKTTQLILEHALARGASDIHLAPGAQGTGIRERIDGVLAPVEPPLPSGAHASIVQAFKARADIDADAPGPQQGRFFVTYDDRQVDVRLDTYPTGLGESLTLRLLDLAALSVDLDATGISKEVLKDLRRRVRTTRGVLIVNGPTNSGKSTTLYCLLNELSTPGRKVMTVEDPVELHLDGLLQANVTTTTGFPDAMRAMARNDLDVGMVSEMRDPESLQLIFQIASVGHLMLTAMHAPDATTCLERIQTIGAVEPSILEENLLGVLDQRLLKKCCPHCRAMRPPQSKDAKALGLTGARRRHKVAHNAGCKRCRDSGVLGRTVAAHFDHDKLRTDMLERVFSGDVTVASAIETGCFRDR